MFFPRFLIILLVLFLAVYFFYQARGFVFGPKVLLVAPKNGEVLKNSHLLVRGLAKNVSSLSLNDRPIFLDQEGRFEEDLLLAAGYNIIEITARDNFGREVKENRIVFIE